jgi:hypothetical protein
MTNRHYVFKPLTVPTLLLFMTLTLSWFVYEEAEAMKAQSHQSYDKEIGETETLFNQINQLQQKVELVNTYYGRFSQIHDEGLLISNQRVMWLDELMETLVRHDLKKASISFSPKASIAVDEVQRLAFVAKRLKREQIVIEGELQHEADLLRILTDIKNHVNSLALLESCELSNLVQPLRSWRADYQFHRDRGNVGLKCVINLISFDVTSSDKGSR